MSTLSPDRTLDEDNVAPDPLVQFDRWFADALAASIPQVEAMALATADADGRPGARMVLLKAFDAGGFTFYSNYQSRKSRDLLANPRASLLFFWPTLERQIRVEGEVHKVPEAESDAYFHTRPRDSRIGAWASPQSEVIAGRAVLEKRFAELKAQFGAGTIPRPPHWGGYRLVPNSIEFWQGRDSRLHDRLRYSKRGDHWALERLAP